MPNNATSVVFEEGIKREAPSMLRKLLDLPLPEPFGRFWLPVVQTSLKESVLTGLYDSEVSEAEDGVKQFATTYLKADHAGCAPISGVLRRYAEFCQQEHLPQVPKMGFLKTLRDRVGIAVEKKQKRIGGKQIWHYTGVTLNV